MVIDRRLAATHLQKQQSKAGCCVGISRTSCCPSAREARFVFSIRIGSFACQCRAELASMLFSDQFVPALLGRVLVLHLGIQQPLQSHSQN